MAYETANSFKFSTIVYIILGLILPLWPITLPLFFFLAYKSYKRGTESQATGTATGMVELKHARDLLDSGSITQEEFNRVKRKAIERD